MYKEYIMGNGIEFKPMCFKCGYNVDVVFIFEIDGVETHKCDKCLTGMELLDVYTTLKK